MQNIEQNIIQWTHNNLGNGFSFREYQLEKITEICKNILDEENHTQIIEAPTGSGKSLLNIISAGVMADVYDKPSYILVSDLFLWKQYEDFIRKYKSLDKTFAVIKGQTGNYKCELNGKDMRNSICRMAGISWQQLFNKKFVTNSSFGCAAKCPYVKARKKALNSKVVIMTYQLYHYSMNIVAKQISNESSNSVFKPKDIIFCDECHNIPEIVANCFKPTVKQSDFNYLNNIFNYRREIQLDLFDEYDSEKKHDITIDLTKDEFYTKFNALWENFSNKDEDNTKIKQTISEYCDFLNIFSDAVDEIEKDIKYIQQTNKRQYTKQDIDLYSSCSWFRNTLCFWNDFLLSLQYTGNESIVKQVYKNNLLNETEVSISNVKEDFLCKHFFFETAKYRILMSATTGGEKAFSENVGLKYLDDGVKYSVIPSTFDFSKSPVYVYSKYKMVYAEKDRSFKALQPIIFNICGNIFKDKRGMIQTGSYYNAKMLYDLAPDDIKKRMLLYNNSKEKNAAINIHKKKTDTILIGPTLVEGIDLPGEECYFIIILKIPYPVIVDEYVKRKNELFPMWYNSTTSNTVIQGIGRGNRFKEDKCSTFILDGCFVSLYNRTKDQYPIELQNRIKIYK